MSVLTKILTVSTPYFSARATFQRHYSLWSCTSADQTLKWMIGMPMQKAQLALIRMDASISWSPNGNRGDRRQYPTVATNQSRGTNPGNGVTNPPDLIRQKGNDAGATAARPSLQTASSTTRPGPDNPVVDDALAPTTGGTPSREARGQLIKTFITPSPESLPSSI